MSASTKSKSDIFMSIKPEHMGNIASGAKNHEYRGYLLPSRIRRIWFYTTAPVKRLEYVARISTGKLPGEVPEDGGLGNADFNAGKKKSKYGYEIISLWVLKEPISLEKAISTTILKGAPQKYCWVPTSLIRSRPLDKQHQLFSKIAEEDSLVESKEHEAVPAKGLESYFAKEDRRGHDESTIKD
ncbi:hypothetical protein N7466_001186 [Penicillium verhagenii]|uniref:uncharacterized protein n=1 Tax=Penicillium verhagenii TaxID=1562060 RepID=UPI002545075A|nr:uncharacterized protein N7466_001186 [Penicillium verhagenii]KAJ5948171.1 hypothetical protein N7466_001186 [Penicillium verhagenii]